MLQSTQIERIALSAGIGLLFSDAFDARPIQRTLRCSLVDELTHRVVAHAIAGPSGVHHFPNLPGWASEAGSPDQPRLHVLVHDDERDFLPLRIDWPPPAESSAGGARLSRFELMSAPERPAPVGAASAYALLATQDDAPAAWARVVLTTSSGVKKLGCSDAFGKLAIHIPFPTPQRPVPGPIGSPPQPPASGPHALLTLAISYGAEVAEEAARAVKWLPGRVVAPRLSSWLSQPDVRVQAFKNDPASLTTVRFEVGRPTVLRTANLDPGHSELRLLS